MRWLSEITPAVAALMGAGIALVGALLSQLISHRFTAQRERQGEIRSRQYDAIIRAAQALEKPEDVSGMLKQVEVEESLEQRQARVSVARPRFTPERFSVREYSWS